jgi:hypothetical protein
MSRRRTRENPVDGLWIGGVLIASAVAGYFVWKAVSPATTTTSTGHPGLPTSGPSPGATLLSNPTTGPSLRV